MKPSTRHEPPKARAARDSTHHAEGFGWHRPTATPIVCEADETLPGRKPVLHLRWDWTGRYYVNVVSTTPLCGERGNYRDHPTAHVEAASCSACSKVLANARKEGSRR